MFVEENPDKKKKKSIHFSTYFRKPARKLNFKGFILEGLPAFFKSFFPIF